MDEGIGAAPVSICAVLAVVLRPFQIFFFDDLLAFDHAVSAVGAFVLALLPDGSAAGAVFIVLDLRSGDFLLRGRTLIVIASKARAIIDPAKKFEEEH